MWGTATAFPGAGANSARPVVILSGCIVVALTWMASSAEAQVPCGQPSGETARELIQLADCYRGTNQMVRASDALNRALETSPTAAETIAIHARLAAVLTSLGDYQNA